MRLADLELDEATTRKPFGKGTRGTFKMMAARAKDNALVTRAFNDGIAKNLGSPIQHQGSSTTDPTSDATEPHKHKRPGGFRNRRNPNIAKKATSRHAPPLVIDESDLSMSAWQRLVTTRLDTPQASIGLSPITSTKMKHAIPSTSSVTTDASRFLPSDAVGESELHSVLSNLADDSTASSGVSSERFDDGMLDEATLCDYDELDAIEPERLAQREFALEREAERNAALPSRTNIDAKVDNVDDMVRPIGGNNAIEATGQNKKEQNKQTAEVRSPALEGGRVAALGTESGEDLMAEISSLDADVRSNRNGADGGDDSADVSKKVIHRDLLNSCASPLISQRRSANKPVRNVEDLLGSKNNEGFERDPPNNGGSRDDDQADDGTMETKTLGHGTTVIRWGTGGNSLQQCYAMTGGPGGGYKTVNPSQQPLSSSQRRRHQPRKYPVPPPPRTAIRYEGTVAEQKKTCEFEKREEMEQERKAAMATRRATASAQLRDVRAYEKARDSTKSIIQQVIDTPARSDSTTQYHFVTMSLLVVRGQFEKAHLVPRPVLIEYVVGCALMVAKACVDSSVWLRCVRHALEGSLIEIDLSQYGLGDAYGMILANGLKGNLDQGQLSDDEDSISHMSQCFGGTTVLKVT